ncbi:sulfotransferase family 2 domain-containing protein [Cohnella herbarum]|uniref:Sulfotransferase family protein n=1 Tax=Cohnella herbarum TaxID=2728023 RepID=A0A7Z2ZMR4_9BACL|nr:sulfotransferase family 2 domain-containing protein [Cohnella herbarum]QJD85130.1 sulfotransferase family protein [Cohnella herbarum]
MDIANGISHPFLFFIHVPKTAGSSIFQFLYRVYEDRIGLFYEKDVNEWNQVLQQPDLPFDCVFGHYWYGLHDSVNRPFEYTAFVRDPIEAILSYIYFINRRVGEWPYLTTSQTITPDNLSDLPEEMINLYFRNYQTAYLAGKQNASAEETKKIINFHYPILGITEMFHESVYLLKRRYNWGPVEVYYVNVTPNRPTRKQFSKGTIQRIQKLVNVDTQIYHYAKKRLQQAIRSLPSNERELIEQFKKTGRLP